MSGSIDEVLDHAEVAVVGTKDPAVVELVHGREDLEVIDLVRIPANGLGEAERYHGLCW